MADDGVHSRAMGWAIRASSALFGFALAIALAPRLVVPARAGDTVSALQAAGQNPRGLLLQFALAVVLPALMAIAGGKVAGLLDGFRWAGVTYCVAALSAPVALIHFGNLRHVLLLGLVAAVVVAARRRDPWFGRGDVVLIPAVLSCYIAFLDLGFGGTPVSTLIRAAIAVVAVRVAVRSSDAMVAAPLALVAQIDWLAPRTGAWVALALLFLTPPLLALTRIRVPRRVVYPIVVFVYLLAVLEMPPPSTANFFEDGHNVPVAGELMRGERPYRDIIPTHGLVSDALIDFTAMKVGATSLRTINTVRLIFGMLTAVGVYFLAFAATGSAEAGLLAAFLAFSRSPNSMVWLRAAGGLFALAGIVAATRLRSRKRFGFAGALVVLAYLVSADIGVYTAIVAFFAAFRSRALRSLVLGMLAAAVPLLLLFALFGFAGDFVRVNLFETLGGGGAYFSRPLSLPECLRTAALGEGVANCLNPLLWIVALVTTCAALARSPLRAKRSDGVWLIGVWIVVAAASWVMRGNDYFFPALIPFAVGSLHLLSRTFRGAAIVLFVVLVLLVQPFTHVITTIPALRSMPPGPLFDAATESSIAAARRFTATLGPDETFADFSNSALLYWILGRDCPLRQVEAAHYQSVEAQREVIRRLEANPRVRAVLIAFPGSVGSVDGIPNSVRAPLVHEWFRNNFTPAFDEEGVVFWRRVR